MKLGGYWTFLGLTKNSNILIDNEKNIKTNYNI